MNTKKTKQLSFGIGVAIIALATFVISANYYANAYLGGDGGWPNSVTAQNANDIQNFQTGMENILDKYGMLTSQPNNISRDDYLKMQGEMYDLMQKYGYNPGDMMGGYPGGMMGGGCGMYPYGYNGEGAPGIQTPSTDNSPSNQGTMETFPGNPGFVPSQI